MIWRSIQYDLPEAAFLLFLVIMIAAGWTALNRYRHEKLESFADPSILEVVVEKRQPLVFWMKTVLLCLAWILAVLALMQPKGNAHYVTRGERKEAKEVKSQTATLRKKMHEVVLLVDASASMGVKDAHGGMTRLEVAKAIGDEIISHLRGENVSLYAFTSATLPLVPSTTDYLFTRLMLKEVQINEGETAGTNIQQVLEDIKNRYFAVPTEKPTTIILLTDGGDTQYQNQQGEDKEKALKSILKPLETIDEKYVHLFIVGIGSKEGQTIPNVTVEGKAVRSAVDEALLKRMAIASRGQLFMENEMNPSLIAQAIAEAIARNGGYETKEASRSHLNDNPLLYDYYYKFPLGLALVTLALFLLLPDTRKKRHNDSKPNLRP